mgnify:CR=1 FL=1
MTIEALEEIAQKLRDEQYIFLVNTENGMWSAMNGYAEDIILMAVKGIIRTAKQIEDVPSRELVKRAAVTLHEIAELMEAAAKEKAPEAAATAQGAGDN